MAIFDRSWDGRVMVERLEGFCTEEEWKRAYREMNEFERQLVDLCTILVKFWIHISQDEQLRRFELRKETPYKAWKLTDEDWRNRQKWDLYEGAINDMLLKTSTLTAPWTIAEGNCKWYARVKALWTLVEVLSEELDYVPADPMAQKAQVSEVTKGKRREKSDSPELGFQKLPALSGLAAFSCPAKQLHHRL
jgi:polyphosphate kinase 2 (PPK2 family)